MESIFQDFRYALRQLRKNSGFAVIVVATLALAIGANTAIFSVAHTVLFAPLPYPNADRLMMIWGRNVSRGDRQFSISAGDFADWEQKNDVFEDVAASYDNEVTLTGAGDPKFVLGYAFTPNYFHILGVAPMLGRTFTYEEAQSHANLAVLSEKFWRTVLYGDPQILGKSITLDAKAFTVIGVMPPDFNYPPKTELWMPMSVSPAISGDYEHRYIRVMGRLKSGVSVATAQTRMDALERQIAAQHPQTDAGNETSVEPLRQQLSGDIRMPLLALLGAVGLVLLIACVNIASLLLARAASRRGELSVRVAIGASRLRLLRQFLIDSLLISFLGGALGVLLARWGTRFLLAIFPNDVANLSIPKVEAIPMNGPILWFALGITVLTALLFSVVPAMQSASGNEVLKESGRSLTSSLRSLRLRRALVTAEVALSLVLLTVAGLMTESFRRVYRENLGFRPEGIVALEVFLPGNRYPHDQLQKQSSFVNNVIDHLNALPGVQSAAATNFLPLTGFWGSTDFLIEGQSLPAGEAKLHADDRLVTPGYFLTMGIALLGGRDFTGMDRSNSEQVAIVNSSLAQRYFGSQDPLGKILQLGDPAHPERWRIVGLVSDVKAFGPEQVAHADIYRPLAQASFPLLAFTVRTAGDPSVLLQPAKQAIWEVDKEQPIFEAMPVEQLASQSVTLRRTSTILLAGFAVLALTLAAVGLYGVMAYSVVQRTHEIGIRIALGARQNDVLRLVVVNGMRAVAIGEIIGLVTALAVTHTVSTLLFGVSPNDPGTIAAAVCVLSLVTLFASYIPARRAAKTDPIVALRYE